MMKRSSTLHLCSYACFVLAAGAGALLAAIPEVEAGECLYLLGAPPGEPEAADQARAEDSGVLGGCGGSATTVVTATNRAHENGVEVFIDGGTCDAFAWVSHDFQVSGSSWPTHGTVSMAGAIRGALPSIAGADGAFIQINLQVQLLELDAPNGGESLIDQFPVILRQQLAEFELEETFGAQVEGLLQPGRRYRLRLLLEAILPFEGGIVQFGNNGIVTEERGAWYDSIEVCIDEPLDLTEIENRLDGIETKQDESLANQDAMQLDLGDIQTTVEGNSVKLDEALTDHDGLEANQDAIRTELGVVRGVVDGNSAKLDELLARQAREHLEWQLYQKDCLPSLWLPAAEGGKIELARDLVADRLASAEATGAKGANTKVARERLEAADGLIAAADYQTDGLPAPLGRPACIDHALREVRELRCRPGGRCGRSSPPAVAPAAPKPEEPAISDRVKPFRSTKALGESSGSLRGAKRFDPDDG